MKKLICALLALTLLVSTAFAAEWPEGRGPAKPYYNSPEVDLTTQMGYIFFFPRGKMEVENFCDTLKIYLPREDLALGSGSLRLYDGRSESERISFSDAERVSMRPMTEKEMEWLMWGGGTCFEVRLTTSLRMNNAYYVRLDEGCFTTADGALKSRAISSADAWIPVLTGTYGVNSLYYTRAGTNERVVSPKAGDKIHFELVMSDEVKYAVIFSDNDSVSFDTPEYTKSGTVTGTVTKDDLNWGVVFLDEAGNTVRAVWLAVSEAE